VAVAVAAAVRERDGAAEPDGVPVAAGVPVSDTDGVAVSEPDGVPVCVPDGDGVPVWLALVDAVSDVVALTDGVADADADGVLERVGVADRVADRDADADGVPVLEPVAEPACGRGRGKTGQARDMGRWWVVRREWAWRAWPLPSRLTPSAPSPRRHTHGSRTQTRCASRWATPCPTATPRACACR
jgi:hypothetical protein